MKPVLQLALDFLDLPRAVKVAKESAAGGADWIEAGTPLIKSEGLNSVRVLKQTFPDKIIIADMKIVDAGRIEMEAALKAGARHVHVLAAASDGTIRECLEAAENYGGEVIVDLIETAAPVKRAQELEALGVHYVCVHTGIDEQMKGDDPFRVLRRVAKAVKIPVAVAGGIHSENAAEAVRAGASIVIIGGAITKSEDAKRATQLIKRAMQEGVKITTDLYKRGTSQNIRDILMKVSTANISDAMHRSGDLKGIYPVVQGVKMAGQAVTVRTYPGDWAKTVEAIDVTNEGDVIVIDAGGTGPAVWGELATNSCLQKKISGVVIDGAIRDSVEIRALKFPAYSKLIMPTAGEPKGFGEIGVPIMVGGVRIHPGDWVVGDDDGVVVLAKDKAVEIANRAMDVLERENRLRKEIQEGSTLAQVGYLKKWEKK